MSIILFDKPVPVQLHKATERAAVTESEVREEVAAEMATLLCNMEASFKART